jgi:hypothetical protein
MDVEPPIPELARIELEYVDLGGPRVLATLRSYGLGTDERFGWNRCQQGGS